MTKEWERMSVAKVSSGERGRQGKNIKWDAKQVIVSGSRKERYCKPKRTGQGRKFPEKGN